MPAMRGQFGSFRGVKLFKFPTTDKPKRSFRCLIYGGNDRHPFY